MSCSLLCLLDAGDERSTSSSSKVSKSVSTPSPPSLPSKDSPLIPPQLGPERVISEEDFEPVGCYVLQMTVGCSADEENWVFRKAQMKL